MQVGTFEFLKENRTMPRLHDKSRSCISVLGEERCGKTSLIEKYVYDKYVDDRKPLSGNSDPVIETTLKKVDWDGEEQSVVLLARNTSRYVTQTNVEYESANCFIVMYDQSSAMTLGKAREYLDGISCYQDDVPCVIVAGKCDLDAEVDMEIAQDFARDNNVPLMSCSAKTGEGVTAVFEWCMQQIFSKNKLNAYENSESEISTKGEQDGTNKTDDCDKSEPKKTTTCTLI